MDKGWRTSAVAVLLLMLLMRLTTTAGAQIDVENSISLQTYACPPGMTAATLVRDECSAIAEGFEVEIISLEGIMEPLTLADAVREETRFVWDNVIVDDRGAYGLLAIEETTQPSGYTDYVVVGEGVELNEFGDWTFTVASEDPTVQLRIYNFTSADSSLPAASPGATQDGQEAAILTGTCDDLGETPGTTLETLTIGEGPREGARNAVPVATSASTVDIAFEELLASDHAVVVFASEQEPSEDEEPPVACGEIGGTRLPDGSIVIGLREVEGSGVVGVASVSPLPESADQTNVTLFVSRELT